MLRSSIPNTMINGGLSIFWNNVWSDVQFGAHAIRAKVIVDGPEMRAARKNLNPVQSWIFTFNTKLTVTAKSRNGLGAIHALIEMGANQASSLIFLSTGAALQSCFAALFDGSLKGRFGTAPLGVNAFEVFLACSVF